MTEIILSVLRENGVACEKAQAELLSEYLAMLFRENEKFNLTAVADPETAAVTHVADSLLPLRFIKSGSLIDIGSGGGLPSLPIAIMRPDVSVTALDATGKKTGFISRAARELGLENVTAVCGRAEELSHDPAFRERFDTATARAVARLNVLSELSLPFVRPGGVFLALKGRDGPDELSEALGAIRTLGGEATDSRMTLAGGGETAERHIISVRKISPCPAGYPRRYAKIKSSPL